MSYNDIPECPECMKLDSLCEECQAAANKARKELIEKINGINFVDSDLHCVKCQVYGRTSINDNYAQGPCKPNTFITLCPQCGESLSNVTVNFTATGTQVIYPQKYWYHQ